jgi:hypothetical protein
MNKVPATAIESWIAKRFDYTKRTGRNGEELVLANPFYHNDKRKFNINLAKATCHDWRGDHWAGPVNPQNNRRNCSFIKFVRLYLKCSYAEAIKDVLGSSVDLKQYLYPENRITDEAAKSTLNVRLPESSSPLIPSNKNDDLTRILSKWLYSRGYDDQSILKSDLHYVGMDVYWPYYEFDTLVYWQSRSCLNKRFEFPSLHVYDVNGSVIGTIDCGKGDFFYGFDDVDHSSYLIITEAIFDKNTLGEQALASGGALLTQKQIKKIKLLGPKKGIILSPDRDRAGIESIINNYEMLNSLDLKLYYSLPPNESYKDEYGNAIQIKDWNDLGRYVSGFDGVRTIHDENIIKLNTSSLVKLYELLNGFKMNNPLCS